MLSFDLQRFALDSYVICYPYCPSDENTGIGQIKDAKGKTWSKTPGGQGNKLPIQDSGRYNIFFPGYSSDTYAKMDQTISLGDKDFTIEGWAYMQSDSGYCARIFELSTGSGYVKRILFGHYQTNTGQGLVDFNDGHGTHIINNCITYNTWFHFAIVYKYSTNQALTFIDGVLKDTQTCSSFTKGSATYTLYLGKSTFSDDGMFMGYIAEFCISNGIARYSSNFATPTTYMQAIGVEIPKPVNLMYVNAGTLKSTLVSSTGTIPKFVRKGTLYYLNLDTSNTTTSGLCTIKQGNPGAIIDYKVTAKPTINANNQNVSAQSGAFNVTVNNMTSSDQLTFTVSDNSISKTYDSSTESWTITSLSKKGTAWNNGTLTYTFGYSNYFYGTVTVNLSATNSIGTTTKSITFKSNYVPPFKAFSLSEQTSSTTLTWHKIKTIISDGKASSWTVGSRISYTVTNSSSFSTYGWSVSTTYVMYLGNNHDTTTNTADFAWTNNSSSNNGKLYPMVNCSSWSWAEALTGNDVTGHKTVNFIRCILSGSGKLKKVISSAIKKNTYISASDSATTLDTDNPYPFLLFDPNEIKSNSGLSSLGNSVYSGITFHSSFWTRRYYYYFDGTSFVNDQNASRTILLVFRI